MKNIILFIIVLAFVSGCSKNIPLHPGISELTPAAAAEQYYKITSLIEYNSTLCGSTSFHHRNNSFNTGLWVIIKDKETGEEIKGDATESLGYGGRFVSRNVYACNEGLDSEDVIITAYAPGYSPLVFNMKYPKDKLAVVDAMLVRSCSGGPDYFDNINISALIERSPEEYISKKENRIYELVHEAYGMGRFMYELDCIEGVIEREGFIKGKGLYRNSSYFEFYHSWPACGSGGSCSGSHRVCFITDSYELYKSVKMEQCPTCIVDDVEDRQNGSAAGLKKWYFGLPEGVNSCLDL